MLETGRRQGVGGEVVGVARDDRLQDRQGLAAVSLLHHRRGAVERLRHVGHPPRVRQLSRNPAAAAAAQVAEARQLGALRVAQHVLRPDLGLERLPHPCQQLAQASLPHPQRRRLVRRQVGALARVRRQLEEAGVGGL